MKKNIVVIGSGLAGSLISNELADKCNVTLLETGKKATINYPEIKFLKKDFASVKTFCLGGGGTTNLWHNGLIPILPQDVTSDEFTEVLADAERYLDKAAHHLFFIPNSYSTEYEKVVSRINNIAKKTGTFPNGVDCLLYPKKFRKLDIVPSVNAFYSAENIDFVSENNRISAVQFCIGSKYVKVDADMVVISAGALGSPMLVKKALAAVRCPSKGVGSGLADHPMGFIGKVKVKKQFNNIMKELSVHDWGSYESRAAIRLKSSCGNYTGCAFLRPAMTMSNKLHIYKYKSLVGASSGTDRFKNMLSWKFFHPDILAEIYSHLFKARIPGRIYNILVLFEQKRGENFVSHNDSGLTVSWCITKQEMTIYKLMINQIHDILYGISDEIKLQNDLTGHWLWSAAHHSGTISLGQDKKCIIDKNLKIKACDNVFVCDGSVIQEHSYANTGLTIGSLAMRLADRICSD